MHGISTAETVIDRLDRWADLQGDNLLYSFLNVKGEEIERHTYRSFQQRSIEIATHLTNTLGYKYGDRLLLAYPSGLEMMAAFFACARVGIVPVPVAPIEGHGRQAALFRLAHVARDCDASGVLTSSDTLADAAAFDNFVARLRWTATDTLTGESGPLNQRVGNTLFLQYTSGSTSNPRGVIVSHSNILHNCAIVIDYTPICVSWLPQHHDMGLIGHYLFSCLMGGRLVGFSPTTFIQRPALWFETITAHLATATSAPNFALEYCLRPGRITKATLAGLDLSSLRMFHAGAEPVKPSVYNRFLQTFIPCGLDPRCFYVAYGLAENTLAVSSYGRQVLSLDKKALASGRVEVTRGTSGITRSTHLMSCGQTLGDVEIKIVDPATHEALPDNAIGEIWISGKSKCAGYWNDPESSQRTFAACIANSDETTTYLRTGDMGFWRDGELYVSGRLKEMMIIRGQNVFPHDIETVAERAADGLRKGCISAFQIENEGGEATLCVVAELVSTRAEVDPRAVAGAIQSYLGLEVGIVSLIRPHEMPKTSSGKIMRLAARDKFLARGFTELARWGGERAPNINDIEAGGPLDRLKARYKLSGTENIPLSQVGVDSLDLLMFVHELRLMLEDGGAETLAKMVDSHIVQQITIADMFRLHDLFASAPEVAVGEAKRLVTELGAKWRASDLRLMDADSRISFKPRDTAVPQTSEVPQAILLTGATGFLGPFILKSLVEQTTAKIHTVVRAGNEQQGLQRILAAGRATGFTPETLAVIESRIVPMCGDLERPHFGLDARAWDTLADRIDAIYHNAAIVNYLFDYNRMRAGNIAGTQEALKFAFERRIKTFNHISTTFIFGWATKPVLLESDTNAEMALLDFGYSQSKWASERIVANASQAGLPTRIFRPALISPSIKGEGNNYDIAIRLLAFMIRHGISVTALNQVSFTPADVVADNVVGISSLPDTVGGIFHVTRDDYAKMSDITDIITDLTGRRFTLFDLPDFVPEVIRRCTPGDLLFPLVDFLVNSVDNISSMEFKRYDSSNYQRARAATPFARPDPTLHDTVAGILRFMDRKGII